jgi:hypothetical protein
VNYSQCADRIKVAWLGGVNAGLALGHDYYGFVITERIDQLNRAFPAYCKRQNRMGKQDSIPHRQDGKWLL